MSDLIRFVRGLANRVLPGAAVDGSYADIRVSQRGEQVVHSLWGSRLHGFADEGSMLLAMNPTPGTAIAGIAAPTAFADTSALMYMRQSPTSTKRLYLLDLELGVEAAGTSSTNWNVVMKTDRGNSRYSSGGSVITPVNANPSSALASEASVYFGALTLAAASSDARLIDHERVQTVIKVIGSKYRFVFGDSSPGAPSGIPLEGTTQHARIIHCPPVVLGPGDAFAFHEFAASQAAAATYQFKARWIER